MNVPPDDQFCDLYELFDRGTVGAWPMLAGNGLRSKRDSHRRQPIGTTSTLPEGAVGVRILGTSSRRKASSVMNGPM